MERATSQHDRPGRIGLGLTLIHIISIPVTGPIVGAALGGLVYRFIGEE